jgi:hypothetical protein
MLGRAAARRSGIAATILSILLALLLPAVGPMTVQAQSVVPSVIALQGTVRGAQSSALLMRRGGNQWVWVEGPGRFNFVAVSESAAALVIYDSGRNVYHNIDLANRRSFVRIGAGAWAQHYSVVSAESPRRAILE